MPLTTTLAEIRSHGPCYEGFEKIRDHFGVSAADAKNHTTPFPIELLLETNDLWDALWVFDRVAPQKVKDDFLIRRLDTGEHSALKSLRINPVDADWWRNCEAAIINVVSLLHRRMAGEDVAAEIKNAADAAARADATYAAAAAADAAAATYAAADATYATEAAARAADAAAEAAARAAARAAADAAARSDLIAAIEAA